MRRWFINLGLAAWVVSTACERPITVQPEGEASGQPSVEEQSAPDEASGNSIQGPNYTVEQIGAAFSGADGVGSVRLRVTPSVGFKLNLLYPWQLSVPGTEAVSVEQGQWDRESAETFGEQEAVFVIPVSSSAEGANTLPGHLNFSVCNDSRCDLPQEDVEWEVTVQ